MNKEIWCNSSFFRAWGIAGSHWLEFWESVTTDF